MRKLNWKVAAAVAVAVAAALIATPFAMAESDQAVNSHPGYIQVYNDNVENLPTVDLRCHGDWKDLVYYMKTQPTKPDVYMVHQISGRKQLNQLVSTMERMLGVNYGSVIADPTPKKMNSPCGAPKDYQTNAVIYRTGRFSAVKTDHNNWQAQRKNSRGECVNNTQARTQAVKVKLKDKVSDKHITVASVHWPTGAKDGPPCASSNAREVARELTQDGYGGALRIAGGDFNVVSEKAGTTDFRGWYKKLNGDLGGKLGLRDVIYDRCKNADAKAKCLRDNWTVPKGNRIDLMFAGKPGGMPKVTAAHTVTFNEGDAADRKYTKGDRRDRDYSHHRAVRAHIHY